MSISAIGNGGFNLNFTASVQAASPLGGAQQASGLDPLGAAASTAGIAATAGAQGNSSVNTVNALATALLVGILSGGEEDKKKQSDSLAGTAAALLAYTAIMGLNQGGGMNPASSAQTASAVSSVGFSAIG